MARLACAILSSLALLVGGCGAAFELATPPGFVELDEDSQYDYRAVTADGLVIAVRVLDHEPQGEIGFWARAIENRMRSRGYALLESRDVKCKSGQSGKQLRFGHDEGRQPHLYTMSVFVTESTIFLVEAGGTKELMDQHGVQTDWAVSNFVIK